jgi:DNA-binding response OmpR family regulator
LVVSGRTSPIDRAHATEVGASAYLIKPFGRREFSKHVSALLGIPEAAPRPSSAPSQVKSPQPSAREAGSLERVEDY